MQRRWKTALVTAVLVAAATGPGSGAAAAAPEAEEHCVLRVVAPAADGGLRTAPMVCSASREVALARAATTATAADWAIGVHYDGAGFTGSSVTVVGADCTGGWLNLPANWNDRISSTLHGCPHIRHFVHANLTGPAQTTAEPGANLGPTLNNEVSSIQYLP
jgi:hypothetical protein